MQFSEFSVGSEFRRRKKKTKRERVEGKEGRRTDAE